MDKLDSINFHQLARKEKNAQKRIRLLALAHFKDGKNRSEIARSLKVSRSSVNNWVSRFIKLGLEGLEDKPRSGRPSTLSEEQVKRLQQYIELWNDEHEDIKLTGVDINSYIKREFDVEFEPSHIYRLIKKLELDISRK
ncbi:helix-turn-helix domain-containing protein [Photobacterium rosenbergii]|uniref:helix-turn-helix domain-containing protein n=1 Tax=Photobacterium rosenbergii TaxID=294936 RepID=UPI001C990196|nr:helix-turn-helix domain-containing protein [Photobacterium rosenbergii]MBY5947384.1 helix-turn-helix domain-containing protein [Photobacterium rosenbergii]